MNVSPMRIYVKYLLPKDTSTFVFRFEFDVKHDKRHISRLVADLHVINIPFVVSTQELLQFEVSD